MRQADKSAAKYSFCPLLTIPLLTMKLAKYNEPHTPCAQFGCMKAHLMRIISRRTLREFAAKRSGHKDATSLIHALEAWFHEVHRARWKSTADVKRHYATASIVTADRIVFNINGNAYRPLAAVDFEKGIVWVKWIGTHQAYDRIDVVKVQHGK